MKERIVVFADNFRGSVYKTRFSRNGSPLHLAVEIVFRRMGKGSGSDQDSALAGGLDNWQAQRCLRRNATY